MKLKQWHCFPARRFPPSFLSSHPHGTHLGARPRAALSQPHSSGPCAGCVPLEQASRGVFPAHPDAAVLRIGPAKHQPTACLHAATNLYRVTFCYHLPALESILRPPLPRALLQMSRFLSEEIWSPCTLSWASSLSLSSGAGRWDHGKLPSAPRPCLSSGAHVECGGSGCSPRGLPCWCEDTTSQWGGRRSGPQDSQWWRPQGEPRFYKRGLSL